MVCDILRIQDDALTRIFYLIENKDLHQVKQVNRRFNQIATKVWEHRLHIWSLLAFSQLNEDPKNWEKALIQFEKKHFTRIPML